MEIELAQKRIRAINGCIKVANFPFFKTLDDFDFGFQPGINKQEFLDFATLRFIEKKENILLVGTSGVGKTHLATAIGMESAKNRFSTYFISFHSLMSQLKKALDENRLESRMKFFARYKVLIIDEIGYLPYLMWTQTFHIRNTVIALLVPNLLMSAFNVIMMRTYFTANIPDSVVEAAREDGANEFKILFRIVFPMALPIIATISLLVGLAYWNDWMNGLYYVNDDRMYSIQVLLMNIQRNLDQLRQQAKWVEMSIQQICHLHQYVWH